MLCCHVRREMRVSHVMLRNVLYGCMNVAWALFWGEAGARNLVFFRVKWLQPAMKGTSCARRVRLRSFHARIGFSSVFCNEWLFLCASLHAFLESLVADRIGMAA